MLNLALLLSAGATFTSQAQEVEEVVVEGEQTGTEVLDDFASVTALDAEKLADAGIENVEDAAAYVPNLSLSQSETGTNIFIRGVGSGVNQGFDQSVGLFSDGVPLPRANMARSPFLDLASLQVKRGPQYALDGNYAIAGSVHMISNLALDSFKAGVDLNYTPSQKDRSILLTLGGPINDVFAANLVLQRKKSDGYTENLFKNRLEGQNDNQMARLVLGLQGENASIKLKAEVGNFKTKGRNAEVLYDLKTPNASVRRLDVPRNQILTRNARARAQGGVPSPWLIEEDYIYTTRLLLWDIGVNLTPQSTRYGNQSGGLFASNDISYTGYLESLYNNADDPFFPGRSVQLPNGLLNTSLDFKRSADGEEFSENDSQNFTLMAEAWLGETQLLSTTAYIKYDYDETIDGDFSAVPLVQIEQQEKYTQYFQKLEFITDPDAFFQWRGGLWYMDADLEFGDETLLQFTDRTGPNGEFISPEIISPPGTAITNTDIVTELFDPRVAPGAPGEQRPDFLRAMLGLRSFGGAIVSGLDYAHPDRNFEQSQELYAAYLQSTINWSDTLRTVVGLRYTYSEKEALRDIAFVLDDGSLHDIVGERTGFVASAYGRAMGIGAAVLGVQSHTCRYGEEGSVGLENLRQFAIDQGSLADGCLRGQRREETVLPSIGFEWDVSTDLALRASARLAGKLGGFDVRSNTRPDLQAFRGIAPGTFEFEDEIAKVFELGASWYLPDGMGELITTVFYTDFENLQISRSDGKSGSSVDNAGAAKNLGVELEGLIALTERFNINYSLAWIDFEFEEFEFGACHLGRRPDTFFVTERTAQFSAEARARRDNGNPRGTDGQILGVNFEALPQGHIPINYDAFRERTSSGINVVLPTNPETYRSLDAQQQGIDPYTNRQSAEFWFNNAGLPAFCDFSGQTNQFVAEWSGTVSLNYENDISGLGVFRPTLDILYNSGYYTSADQDPLAYQDAFTQLNGRLEIADFDDVWVVALTGENLTNEKIVTYSAPTPFGSGFIGARGYFGFTRPSRSFGVNFRYNFF